jgi:geranylgeranyl diphosphate synthase type II
MLDIEAFINQKKEKIDSILKESVKNGGSSILEKSSSYSVNSNSKRLRAILILSVLELNGHDWIPYVPLAASVEFLHTATLIHDDLPCMDNNPERRGKFSNHKRFGEAQAVLTGDFLFSQTFNWLLDEAKKLSLSSEMVLRIVNILFKRLNDMILGQSDEIDNRGKDIGPEKILEIIQNKTARFIQVCLEIGAVLSGLKEKELMAYSGFGLHFGRAFQITDDLLDILGSQKKEGKNLMLDKKNSTVTLPLKIGVKPALKRLGLEIEEAVNHIKGVNSNTELLKELLYFATQKRLENYI